MSINLHIERLVLDGVNIASAQYSELQTNVESELVELLDRGGLANNFSNSVSVPTMFVSSIQLTGDKQAKFGQKIARSVYGGISRE